MARRLAFNSTRTGREMMSKKRRSSHKTEMWAAISAAVAGGWGPTLRMMCCILAVRGLTSAVALVLIAQTLPVGWPLRLIP